ncbi:hypothetical protein [Actinomadura violacea]|uniref:PH domain-containing protein n=1 Tax=Actinomadura violacea TaxID=2819934 RepID=A0ABS3S7Y5_9ACTN|nr:hypothetical protein [Actinomadura violacea]MBO2464335.1 hypothetical protein [Actinomadura violacea]
MDGAATTIPPNDVAGAAARHGFGALCDVRREVTATAAVITGGVTAVVCALLMWLLSLIPGSMDVFSWVHSLAYPIHFVLLMGFIWGAVYAIRGLTVGSRATYLFEGGLVARRRSGPLVIAWGDLAAVKAVYKRKQGDEGKVAGYKVEGRQGTTIPVPLLLAGGRDAFIDRIIAEARSHGRPVS